MEEKEDDDSPVVSVKSVTDLHRLKIEKLMKNPDKLAFIPDKMRDKRFPDAPEFVRNVMGSSAGAGSGEFHVYRHIRRREYARQEHLQGINDRIVLDDKYHEKLGENQKNNEEKTAKKRAKRHRIKEKKKKKKSDVKKESSSESEVDEDELKHLLELNSRNEKEILKFTPCEIKNESERTDTDKDSNCLR